LPKGCRIRIGRRLTLGSCLAACARAPGRSEGAFRARVHVQPATRLPACSHVDVSEISQVPRRSVLCLCLGPPPGRINDPSPIVGFVDAAPAQTTAKASASWLYRGYRGASAPVAYASRMVLPPSMQGSLPAGWLAFTGRELNPLDRNEGFQITSSSSLPGLFLARRPKTCREPAIRKPSAFIDSGVTFFRGYSCNEDRAEDLAGVMCSKRAIGRQFLPTS
jgi:hypothetical protein